MGFKTRHSKTPAGYRFNRKRLYREIERKRRELDISLREVGRQAGVYEMTISRLSMGMGPTMENYGRLCAWLGAELDEFFD